MDKKLDIVYPLINSVQDNIEFKYSLRSLANYPHWNVYIIGYLPPRVNKTKVKHIDYNMYSPYWHIITSNKLYQASMVSTISDDFIFMNDDIYIIKEVKDIPYYKVWSLEDHLNYFKQKNIMNSYTREILEMYNRYPKWDSFEAHTPIKYNKAKIQMFVNVFWVETLRRSNYCNYYDIEWVLVNSWDYRNTTIISDCKYYGSTNVYWCGNRPIRFSTGQEFVSSNGSHDNLIRYLDNMFPDKCEYEL